MKNLNKIPALIGFALGCVIIFISWTISMVVNGGRILLKTTSFSVKSKPDTYEWFTKSEVRPSTNLLAVSK